MFYVYQRMYCSENCRLQAYNSYHRTECKLLSFEETRKLQHIQFLAVQLLLTWTEQGAQLKALMEKLAVENIFEEEIDPTMQPFISDYLSVLRLCRRFKPSEVERAKSLAVNAMRALYQTGFFKDDSDLSDKLKQVLLMIMYSLFVKFCGQCQQTLSLYPRSGKMRKNT